MLLKSINIKGLLSFRDVELEMRPLNVLVGANASGKSNLIEIMALLQALPRDLAGFFWRGGGIGDWLWKGSNEPEHGGVSTVEIVAEYPGGQIPLRYRLGLAGAGATPVVMLEQLEDTGCLSDGQSEPFRYFHLGGGTGTLAFRQFSLVPAIGYPEPRQTQFIKFGDLTFGQSVLSQRKDPYAYPEITYLGERFNNIHLYREWNMGRGSAIRNPQPTDATNAYLEEDFSNLALILNRLEREGSLETINEQLGRFYETYDSIGVDIYPNMVQLRIREKGLSTVVPAPRLSDGTLRFLALLTILCNPNPPPLICIEEPELGLHPDVIYQVAKLLIEASKRTQLIVTTHSAELIDHLWEDPESVVVCERYPDTGTEFSRLKQEELKDWLERYELGELWRTGEIGGNRF